VQRVVKLLDEMRAQLESDMAEDQKVFDQMVCWCKTNAEEKRKSVESAERKIDELEAEIAQRAGAEGELKVTVPAAKKEIEDNEKALLEAEKIREDEQKAFRAKDKDLVLGIQNLKNAVSVLKKHNSLLQVQVRSTKMNASLRTAMLTALRDIAAQHRETTVDSTDSTARHRGASFVQAGTLSGAALQFYDALTLRGQHKRTERALSAHFAHKLLSREVLAQTSSSSPHLGEYNPASGQIFGIMSAMLDDFKSTKEQAAKDESTAVVQYQELKAAKATALKAAREMLSDKKKAAAENTAALADAKEDLSATRAQRSADVKFLSNLKLQCKDLDSQMAARTAARQAELTAVGEAVSVLTADDNREALARSTSFVQLRLKASLTVTARRGRALKALFGSKAKATGADADDEGQGLLNQWEQGKGGIRLTNPFMDPTTYASKLKSEKKHQLAALAMSVSLDSFDKVKKAMVELIAQLKA
jgi:hypothetical protein